MIQETIKYTDNKHLFQALKQGSLPAFEILYDQYAPVLMGCIYRITNNETIAESVLVKTYVKIWDQRGNSGYSGSTLLGWLIEVARQTAFEEIRSNPALKPIPDFDVHNERENNKDALPINIEQMQQSVFDMLYNKGYSCKQAASTLKISVDELKNCFRTSIMNLKISRNVK